MNKKKRIVRKKHRKHIQRVKAKRRAVLQKKNIVQESPAS